MGILRYVKVYSIASNNRHLEITIENRGRGWGVYRSGFVLSSKTLGFEYEPLPSSRDEEFFKEYRFAIPALAVEAAVKAMTLAMQPNSVDVTLLCQPTEDVISFFKELDMAAYDFGVQPSGLNAEKIIAIKTEYAKVFK